MAKYQFKIGQKVRISEDALAFDATQYAGEIGLITDIHPYPKGYEPPYDVDFGNHEIQSYYEDELEEI